MVTALPERLNSAVIGVDIGGTKIAAGIVTPLGEALHVQTTRTPSSQGAEAILHAVAEVAKPILDYAKSTALKISAMGVSAGGQIDVTTGRVHYATNVITGWSGADIAGVLEERVSLPVTVDNDGNVWALGEHRFGAAKPYRDVLCVAVGTGVGGGLILNNKVHHGNSYSAGDMSHLLVETKNGRICTCGQLGHLEAYAAGPAMARYYSEMAGLATPCELPVVAEKAAAGDTLARSAIEEGARVLGRTLIGVLNLIDPQALVIGGGVIQLGDVWWEPLVEEVRRNPIPSVAQIPVHRASLGQFSAVIGAGALAYSQLE
ncbi:MAG: ROK family protein [Caldilineaceae bacterium]